MNFDWLRRVLPKGWWKTAGPQASPQQLERGSVAVSVEDASAAPVVPLKDPVAQESVVGGGEGVSAAQRARWQAELEAEYRDANARPVDNGRGAGSRRPSGHLGRRDPLDRWGSGGSGTSL